MAKSKPITTAKLLRKMLRQLLSTIKTSLEANDYSLLLGVLKPKRRRGRPKKKVSPLKQLESFINKHQSNFKKNQRRLQKELKKRWQLEQAYFAHLVDKYSSLLKEFSDSNFFFADGKSVKVKKRSGTIFERRSLVSRFAQLALDLGQDLATQKTRRRLFKRLKRNAKQSWKRYLKARSQRRKKTLIALRKIWQEIAAGLTEIITPLESIPKKRRPKRRKKAPKISWTWPSFGKLISLKIPFPNLLQLWRWLISLTARYVYVSIVISGLFLGGVYGIYVFIFQDLPSVNDLVERDQIVTTRILDRNGELLFRIYEDENRTLIKLKELPQHVIEATIAIEDQKFYLHHGFSVQGITRALIANSQGKPIQGGSTITQQLVKNRLLSSERTIRRKLREIILAVLVDASFTKEEILEMYLNQVAYGGATYGIEEAAQTYFDKSARELDLAEASMLAGLPAAPSVYSPFGPLPELGYARQEEVLRRMVEDGYLNQEQASQAKAQILQFRANIIDIKAAHFVMYVRQLLAEKYGESVVNQGGLEVRTSLDLKLQDQTQQVVTGEIDRLRRLHVNNGAALVTNPETGEILAMVGSRNYFDFENDGQVNVVLRPRQPGSSIKPLTYSVALENGMTPSTIIPDTPITYHIAGSKPYSPQNYDGRFHGNVTLKQALASSYNIPAVKTLARIGVDNVIDKGEQMGITTWKDRYRYGLSLTLGGGEVRMLDMAQLYGTFANFGNTVELNPILEVADSRGKVIYRNTCVLDGRSCPTRRNLDPRVAYQINDILSDNGARTPAFGPRSVLHIPGQQVAVKTGTTNNLRDNWTIGYTTDRLVAVWVGNNDNTPMSYVASGITGASPIWNNIMRLLLDESQPHAFVQPSGLVKVSVCVQTGTLACNGCPTVRDEFFIPGTEPKFACNPSFFEPKEDSEDEGQRAQSNAGLGEGVEISNY